MRKVIFFLMLTLLMALPLISANLGTFKTGDCVPIRVLTNCSNINITEITHGKTTEIINSDMTLLSGQTFNYTFCNTTDLGEYTYSWNNYCSDCSDGNCGNNFFINGSGQEVTTPQAILYMFFIIIGFLLLGLTIWSAIKIPFKNPRDEDESIISINDLKYLKIVLWTFVYLEVLFLVAIARNMSIGFLMLNDVGSLFNIIYFIMLSCLLPMFPLLIIFSLILWLTDKKIQKAIQRGIPYK